MKSKSYRFRNYRTACYLVAVLLFAFSSAIHAQQTRKERRDSLLRYRNTTDTNFIRKYPNRLIVTLNQTYRQYDLRFTQNLITDSLGRSAPQLLADANVITGLAFDFDKITFSFGIRSRPATADDIAQKGKTTYSSFGLSFTAYRFRVESSYRNYRGFYDVKANPFDTVSNAYYKNPSLNVRSLRVKTLFIFNKRKFSYNAAYYNSQRQIKSRGSWLGVSNIYQYRFSSDTSLLPPISRPFYGQWGTMDVYNVSGFSIGPGASYNLVLFKLLYLNMTLTSGLDVQRMLLQSSSTGKTLIIWKTGYASDFRAALGWNSRNFFSSLTFRVDYNSYRTNGFRLEPRFYSVDFNIGYRFRMKERTWVKKLKENKWYQLL